MRRIINLHKTKPELTQIFQLVQKDIKTVIINVFHTFKKLTGDMEDTKDQNQTSRDENLQCWR